LFITPPLFIFAGVTLQQIVSRFEKKIMLLVIFLIIVIPGVFSIIYLHPLQYIYFNEFIGGVDAANGQYHLDYYNTIWKVTIDYVNENVPPGSQILIWKEDRYGRLYAENKYKFVAHTTIPVEDYHSFDYAIMRPDGFDDIDILRNSPVIHSIDVGNNSFVVILKITRD
jgi:hypothetical protein